MLTKKITQTLIRYQLMRVRYREAKQIQRLHRQGAISFEDAERMARDLAVSRISKI